MMGTLTSKRIASSKLLSRQRAWQLRNPEKRRAHEILNRAVRSGTVARQPCEVCGSTDHVDGHHEDYSKPLAIVWLCRRHHVARHRKPILKKGPRP